MKKIHIIIILFLVAALAGAYGIRKYNQRDAVFDLNQSGKIAPAFTLPNINGGDVKLSDHKGKLILLNFWASWCPPCRAEIPGFIKVQNENKDKDKAFTFLGVALESKENALRYAKDIGINYPTSYGEEDTLKVSAQYGNPDGGLPYSVLIDKNQKIISVHPGYLSEDKLNELIKKNL